MERKVFISHSSKDKELSEAVYQYLTSQGISCWIDYHDIRPGIAYAKEIMRGIDACDTMVVVYSHHVNSSEDILNEINQFHNAKKTIIPFLTDSTPFSRELDYYLTRRQCIIASEDYRKFLPKLRDALSNIDHLEPDENQESVDVNVPTSYCVVLSDVGAAKLQVVKAVKEALGLGLKEAKDIVDSAPSVIQEGLTYQQARQLKEQLSAAGAILDILTRHKEGKGRPAVKYCVILVKFGTMKLQTVKAVKELCKVGLKEAKDMVDGAPSVIAEGVTFQEALHLKDCIEKTDSKVDFCSQQMASMKLDELKNSAAEEWSKKANEAFYAESYITKMVKGCQEKCRKLLNGMGWPLDKVTR